MIFQWVDINELQNYNIYPIFLKDKITNLSDGVEHFVTRIKYSCGWWIIGQNNKGIICNWSGFSTIEEFDTGIIIGKYTGNVPGSRDNSTSKYCVEFFLNRKFINLTEKGYKKGIKDIKRISKEYLIIYRL